MQLFFILGYLFPFTPLTCLKNENFRKIKRTPGDIIILYKCTKNHDHMVYWSWNMVRDRCNCYFSFWSFLPFYPSNSPNNQNFKKWKKHPEISSFYKCVPKIMTRWCTVPEIWCMMDGQMEKVTYRGGCPT